MTVARDATGRQPTGPAAGPLLGREIELDVGAVAHGGHCVARYEGRVVFVRHTLPGERVVAWVTEDRGGAFCRADAVRVLHASPHRVEPPCPYAGPGRCGGCDWQHADVAAQRELKAGVVREQLSRLGGRDDVPVAVEALPGDALGWRTRVQFAVDRAGRAGFHRHRSHDVEPVDRCLIAAPAVEAAGVERARWSGSDRVLVAATSTGETAVLTAAGRTRPRPVAGPPELHEHAIGRMWTVAPTGFWQVHPAAVETLVDAVLAGLAPRPGERAVDLYAGVGVFAGALAGAVGPAGEVVAVEGDRRAAGHAAANLADLPSVAVRSGPVADELARLPGADLVVLDPPRSGAGADVCGGIAALRPRAVAYVACDPAALARDVRTFAGLGLELVGLRAFDLFPMTSHVEVVAKLVRADADLR